MSALTVLEAILIGGIAITAIVVIARVLGQLLWRLLGRLDVEEEDPDPQAVDRRRAGTRRAQERQWPRG